MHTGIVLLWRPFCSFFRLFCESWDIRTSVIDLDSFASFFLPSCVRLLSVSMDLMLSTEVHELHSNKSKYRLYYDGNIEFLRGEHIPFAMLSIFLTLLFIAIPTLILILDPFRCFQNCLSYCRIQSHGLRAFVLTLFRVATRMVQSLVHMTYGGYHLMALFWDLAFAFYMLWHYPLCSLCTLLYYWLPWLSL